MLYFGPSASLFAAPGGCRGFSLTANNTLGGCSNQEGLGSDDIRYGDLQIGGLFDEHRDIARSDPEGDAVLDVETTYDFIPAPAAGRPPPGRS